MASPAFVKQQAVRARVEAIYNRPESDFPDRPAYDDYLEEREDIIYELTEGGAVAEAEAKLAEHQRVHGAAIAAAAAARAEGLRQQQQQQTRADGAGGEDTATAAQPPPLPVGAAVAPPPPPPVGTQAPPPPQLSPGAARAAAGAAAGWDAGAASARCWKAAFRSMFVR